MWLPQPGEESDWESECREETSSWVLRFSLLAMTSKGQGYVFLHKEAGNIWINELAQSLTQKWKPEAMGQRGLWLQLPEAKGCLPLSLIKNPSKSILCSLFSIYSARHDAACLMTECSFTPHSYPLMQVCRWKEAQGKSTVIKIIFSVFSLQSTFSSGKWWLK